MQEKEPERDMWACCTFFDGALSGVTAWNSSLVSICRNESTGMFKHVWLLPNDTDSERQFRQSLFEGPAVQCQCVCGSQMRICISWHQVQAGHVQGHPVGYSTCGLLPFAIIYTTTVTWRRGLAHVGPGVTWMLVITSIQNQNNMLCLFWSYTTVAGGGGQFLHICCVLISKCFELHPRQPKWKLGSGAQIKDSWEPQSWWVLAIDHDLMAFLGLEIDVTFRHFGDATSR